MTPDTATEKDLETEIARVLEIMERMRDRADGLNEADTKVALIDPILSALTNGSGAPAAYSAAGVIVRRLHIVSDAADSSRVWL